MYWEYYVMGILLIPGLIFAIIAQARVSSNFNKYNKVMSQNGKTAYEVARIILDSANLQNIKIEKTSGSLTDHYNPKAQTIYLSQDVYESSSVASIGIATHEVGHALQYAENYKPIKVRSVLVYACNISSVLLWPLVFIGLLLNFGLESPFGMIFMWSGIAIFGLAVLFNLVTLPVEYNASKKAKQILVGAGILNEEEMVGVNKVLNAAALTYVASLVVAILNLLRFILYIRRRD